MPASIGSGVFDLFKEATKESNNAFYEIKWLIINVTTSKTDYNHYEVLYFTPVIPETKSPSTSDKTSALKFQKSRSTRQDITYIW